jgi:serine/threonine protein kinase
MVSGVTTCPRCGATLTGPNAAEQTERIRLRLQEAIGDSYRLIELLGRGGMGIVFRALELALDREVALKVLALDPILSPEAYARFEREAKLAARLDHPNVVPIFAVGQRNTVAYYTMRLVRGGTLEDMLEGHRSLDFLHAVEILRDVASALDYAHGQGVVHRDIKPANVLISDSGHAMVSDFGIARGLGVGETPLASGAVIGSPGYMSPEQWRGEEIDARADQYALAVMAFEMLTGHRPFETVKVQDLLKLHLSAEVPNASSIKPSLPPFVDLAIKRGMHKNASARFTSATAFIDALAGRRPVTGTRTSIPIVMTEPPVGGVSAGTKAALALAFGAVAIIAGLVGYLRPRVIESATPRPVPVQQDSTSPSPPDSVMNVDTTFDLNAGSRTTGGATHGRAPVAVDPTLFPTHGAPQDVASDGPGYIRVFARGGAARVRIDGRTLGFSPLVARVEPGLHVVSLEGSGDAFLPPQITVNATASDTSIAAFTARVTHATGADSATPASGTAGPKPASSGPAGPSAVSSSSTAPSTSPHATSPSAAGPAASVAAPAPDSSASSLPPSVSPQDSARH